MEYYESSEPLRLAGDQENDTILLWTDELREELNALNKRRAASKYVNRAGEKPFIVVDEGCFREYVLDKLKELKPL